jgi:hypothetical protein
MNEVSLWSLCIDAYHAISKSYVPVMDQTAVEHQLTGEEGWLLLPALSFEPEVISAERLRIRSPYTAADMYATGLEKLADRGFLIPVDDNEDTYRLTSKGRETVLDIVGAAYAVMGDLQPVPTGELEALSKQLCKLVRACLDTPEPPGKWSITHSRQLDPGKDAAVMVRIDQFMSDLAAYRDDCHLAAWQTHQIEGHGWEVFTFLWRLGKLTLGELTEKLERRGFLASEYEYALADLVRRGWIDVDVKEYHLTQLGTEIRENAEAETDRYFYRPWACLSVQEIDELQTQLLRLKEALSTRINGE